MALFVRPRLTAARPQSRSGRAVGRSRGWLVSVYGQRRRLATFAAAGLAVAVGYHVVFGQNGLTAYGQKKQETHSLERQLHDLTRDNEELRGHVDRLQSDPNAIEHEAREELHYTRPGEVIITLPPEQKSVQTKEPGKP